MFNFHLKKKFGKNRNARKIKKIFEGMESVYMLEK